MSSIFKNFNWKLISSTIAGASIATSLYYTSASKVVKNDTGSTFNAFPSYIFGNKLKLVSIKQETPDVKVLKFALPDGSTSGIQPGKAVLAFVKDNDSGKLKVRPYSPLYLPEDEKHLNFAIKMLNENGASGAMHRLKIDDEVTFRGPLPIHTINYGKLPNNVNFIAGGSGITPVFSTIHNILLTSQRNVCLIFANKDEGEVLLRKEIDGLKTKYHDRFKVIYLVDKISQNNGDFAIKGRVNSSVLKEYLYDDAQLFVCGPDGLTKAIKNEYLKGSGLNNKLYVF